MSDLQRKMDDGKMTSKEFVEHVSQLVMKITGVQLAERQKTMVESRLKNRALELQLADLEAYSEYFTKHSDSETKALIALLTTHHSFFFREMLHFDYLEKTGLKNAVEAARGRKENKVRIWSAACSRGQEVYSLAMFLNYHLPRIAPGFTFEIIGTDVDSESVSIAKNGVYHRNDVKEVPMQYIMGNWSKGTEEISDFVRAKERIFNPCRFETVNLFSLSKSVELYQKRFDVIFCRNVFIYFTPDQIKEISRNFLNFLQPEGQIVIGISESLNGLELPLETIGPSIYGRVKEASTGAVSSPAVVVPPNAPVLTPQVDPAPVRILCVDDSPSVITLLKRILSKESGFEVVATAANGLEAAKRLSEMQIDAMTLDIHMPEQTGLEYLQKNMKANHPPVVMISSVSREDAGLAMKCLEMGAADYVEKPALSNLKERGDEIRSKLMTAFRTRKDPVKADLSLEKSFAKLPTISQPDRCLRLIVAGMGDRKKLQDFFKEVEGVQPPTIVLMEGCETLMPALSQEGSKVFKKELHYVEKSLPALVAGNLYLADFSKWFDSLMKEHGSRRTSILIYGDVTPGAAAKLMSWSKAQLLVEDLGKGNSTLKEVASDLVPATSFPYCSIDYLSKSND
jgi:chemotaxis protein methyltransferase CheR